MEQKLVLDSDIISHILRKNEQVVSRFRAALVTNKTLILCPIVYYQIKRGLIYARAERKLFDFEALVENLEWCDFEKQDWEIGSRDWAEIKSMGLRFKGDEKLDTDLLIAAFAKRMGAIVVTRNARDFEPLSVKVNTW